MVVVGLPLSLLSHFPFLLPMDTSSELDLPTVTQLLNNYKGKQPSIRPPLRSSHSDSDSDSDLDAGAPSLNIRSPLSLISPNKSSPSTSYKRYRVRKGFSGEAFREDPFFDPDEYPVLEKTSEVFSIFHCC